MSINSNFSLHSNSSCNSASLISISGVHLECESNSQFNSEWCKTLICCKWMCVLIFSWIHISHTYFLFSEEWFPVVLSHAHLISHWCGSQDFYKWKMRKHVIPPHQRWCFHIAYVLWSRVFHFSYLALRPNGALRQRLQHGILEWQTGGGGRHLGWTLERTHWKHVSTLKAWSLGWKFAFECLGGDLAESYWSFLLTSGKRYSCIAWNRETIIYLSWTSWFLTPMLY